MVIKLIIYLCDIDVITTVSIQNVEPYLFTCNTHHFCYHREDKFWDKSEFSIARTIRKDRAAFALALPNVSLMVIFQKIVAYAISCSMSMDHS